MKRHLFHDEHLLDRYVVQGVPVVRGRFDADLALAKAWLRLTQHAATPNDVQLLRHEQFEAQFMERHGHGYTKAHDAAQARFPWFPENS